MVINNNVQQTVYTPPAQEQVEATQAQTAVSQQESPASEAVASTVTGNEAAVFESSGSSEKRAPASASEIRRMIDETNRQTEALRELIIKMFNRQAEKNGQANGSNAFLRPGEMIEIDAETRAKAQADIDEGGYYSVENTGNRIFDFAVAFAGDDPEKLKLMREATEKGFAEAERIWGGKLPQISYDTMEYVRNRFDERMKELTGAAS